MKRENNGVVSKIASTLVDMLFVPKCASCFTALPDSGQTLCAHCRKRYTAERGAYCHVCKKPHIYCDCRIHYHGFSYPMIHVTSYSITRESVSRNLVLHIKDDRLDRAFDFIAREMCDAFNTRARADMSAAIGRWRAEDTRITWIPRSEKAKRKAGHDQSRELALRIGKMLRTPALPVFYNMGRSSQKSLNRDDRLKNAEESFLIVAEKTDIAGKNIILIDDIVTSGSSLGVCAYKLKAAGAANVLTLVYAKTDRRKGLEEETFAFYTDH